MSERLWSKSDLNILLRLWIDGMSADGIGAEIGRTRSAILSKGSRIGLLQMTKEELGGPSVKVRTCLYGVHFFVSQGVGNRTFSGCKQTDVNCAA